MFGCSDEENLMVGVVFWRLVTGLGPGSGM